MQINIASNSDLPAKAHSANRTSNHYLMLCKGRSHFCSELLKDETTVHAAQLLRQLNDKDAW